MSARILHPHIDCKCPAGAYCSSMHFPHKETDVPGYSQCPVLTGTSNRSTGSGLPTYRTPPITAKRFVVSTSFLSNPCSEPGIYTNVNDRPLLFALPPLLHPRSATSHFASTSSGARSCGCAIDSCLPVICQDPTFLCALRRQDTGRMRQRSPAANSAAQHCLSDISALLSEVLEHCVGLHPDGQRAESFAWTFISILLWQITAEIVESFLCILQSKDLSCCSAGGLGENTPSPPGDGTIFTVQLLQYYCCRCITSIVLCTISTKSGLRLAPPTRAPSISGWVTNSEMLVDVTLPP